MVVLMFQESPSLAIYGEEQGARSLPSEPCLCRSFFLTSAAVTGEVPPKAWHSHVQGLRAAESAGLAKHIDKGDPQCVIFSALENSQRCVLRFLKWDSLRLKSKYNRAK